MGFTFKSGTTFNLSGSGTSIPVTVGSIAAGDLVVLWATHEGSITTMIASDGTSSFTQDAAGIQHHAGGEPHSCFLYLLAAVATGSVTHYNRVG